MKQSTKRLLSFCVALMLVIGSFGCLAGVVSADEAFMSWTAQDQVLTHLGLSTADDTDTNWENYRYYAQPFVPDSATVAGVTIPMNLTHGNATMHIEIRSSVNGTALFAKDIAFTSQGDGRYAYTFDFGEDVAVTAGAQYYLAWWLTDREPSAVAVAYGSIVASTETAPRGFLWKMSDGLPATFTQTTDQVFSFQMLTEVVAATYEPFMSWNQGTTPISHVALATAQSGDANYGDMSYLGQAFVPNVDTVNSVVIPMHLTAGKATAHVEIREEINGAPLVTKEAEFTSTGNALDNYTFTFDSAVTVTPNQKYYLVWWLTARDEGTICLVYGSDLGVTNANPCAYTCKLNGGSATTLSAVTNVVFNFQINSTDVPVNPEPTPEPDPSYTEAFMSWTVGTTGISHVGLAGATADDANYANYSYLGQAFVPNVNSITGAKVYMNLTEGNATLHAEVRETVNGTAIAAKELAITSKGNAEHAYEVNFDSKVTVTAGETYYLVWWLTARDANSVCVAYGSDLGAENVNPHGYASKVSNGSTVSYGAMQHVVFNFEVLTNEQPVTPPDVPTGGTAASVDAMIKAIPAVTSVAFELDVVTARTAYTALPGTEKAKVDQLEKLEKDEADLAALKAKNKATVTVKDLAENAAEFGKETGSLLGWQVDKGQANNWVVHNFNPTGFGDGSYQLGVKVKFTGLANANPAISLKCADETTGEAEKFKRDIFGTDYDAAEKDAKGFATLWLDVTLDETTASHQMMGGLFGYTEFHPDMELIVAGLYWADASGNILSSIEGNQFNLATVNKASTGSMVYDMEDLLYITYTADTNKSVDDELGYLFDNIALGKQASGDYNLDVTFMADEGQDLLFDVEVYVDGNKMTTKSISEADYAAASKTSDGKATVLVPYTVAAEGDVVVKVYQFNGGNVNYTGMYSYLEGEATVNPNPQPDAAVQAVIDAINALPAYGDVTEAHRSAIEAARAAYDLLDGNQQNQVSNYSKLQEAEIALDELVPVKQGDLNGDGTVDAKDALAALKHAVGKPTLSDDLVQLGDMNGDGVLDAKDALAMLKIAVGK